jgi:hypothetical protein
VHRFFVAVVIVLQACSYAALAGERPVPAECTYEMEVRSGNAKTGSERLFVRHARIEMTADETDKEAGCTVCSEDQVVIDVPPIPQFSLCYKLAPLVRFVLKGLVAKGAPIHTIVGYHVTKSPGGTDASGIRTEFGNHSYGTAFDVNPEQNGLYINCVQFGPECKLVRGGPWKPGTPGTIEKDGMIVIKLDEAGFVWGGGIEGSQKDFMHFSLTGQ